MKIVVVGNFHHKNKSALDNYKNITIVKIDSVHQIYNINLSDIDCVYSPVYPINVSHFPNMKFIFGPHFSVFPEETLEIIKGPNTVYNLLSSWVINFWKNYPICNNLNVIALPFGVDTEKFINNKSITEKNNVMVYFKNRSPEQLYLVESFLKNKNINYYVFSYDRKYDEDDYIRFLQNAKYGIIIGRHESQGFAIEEALSCNVPLFVWNVKSMNEEVGYNYDDIPATTIPYWDHRCGEYFYNQSEIEDKFNLFLSKLETYKPREFVLENLSREVCEKKFIDLINSIET